MSTYGELQQRMEAAIARRAVLDVLIQYLDHNFLPSGDTPPKFIVRTDNGLPVSAALIEEEIASMCTLQDGLDAEIASIRATVLEPTTAPVDPPQVTPTQTQNREGTQGASS